MSIGAIYSNRKDIQNINYVEYHVRKGPSNTELETVVTLNKHILLGLFPTALIALEAVEGALVKVGCKQPRKRRVKLTTDNNAVFSGADFVPTTPAWGATISNVFSLSSLTTTYGRVVNGSALAGMDVPLLLRFELTGKGASVYNNLWELWIKVKATGGATGETSGTPQSTGYTRLPDNGIFYLPVGQFVHIKANFNYPSGVTSSSTTLSIYNAYTEALLDTVTLSWSTAL
jgi:hypothetical protein